MPDHARYHAPTFFIIHINILIYLIVIYTVLMTGYAMAGPVAGSAAVPDRRLRPGTTSGSRRRHRRPAVRAVDDIVAAGNVDLHLANFVNRDDPGVIADLCHGRCVPCAGSPAAIPQRGLRYGTHIPAGSAITLEGLYRYLLTEARPPATRRSPLRLGGYRA